MELLDMVPADAIALRMYSLPAAAAAPGSLCAWLVAALAAAAAVGLWSIRAVGASKNDAGVRSGSALVEDKQAQAPPLPRAIIDVPRPAARAEYAEPASPSEPSTPSKVRFTAYYGGSGEDGVMDGVRKCADADGEDVRLVDGEVEMVLTRTASASGRRTTALAAAPWEEREMVVRLRGDLGWYRHLDMAALDGSVVRLWDGELAASPRGRRRRAGLELQLSL
ncbi:uncharacterized protein LOC133897409 [Phragmites australis]|uniref:uncharacterized protein LOC133897409 n=1 Tax=Phragmites australis TaxID=29695 RepID=UPI002D770655|nr:uncharacterized protein LOC133897409 [Phragmites australis]